MTIDRWQDTFLVFQPEFSRRTQLWSTLHVVKWLGYYQQFQNNFKMQINKAERLVIFTVSVKSNLHLINIFWFRDEKYDVCLRMKKLKPIKI